MGAMVTRLPFLRRHACPRSFAGRAKHAGMRDLGPACLPAGRAGYCSTRSCGVMVPSGLLAQTAIDLPRRPRDARLQGLVGPKSQRSGRFQRLEHLGRCVRASSSRGAAGSEARGRALGQCPELKSRGSGRFQRLEQLIPARNTLALELDGAQWARVGSGAGTRAPA